MIDGVASGEWVGFFVFDYFCSLWVICLWSYEWVSDVSVSSGSTKSTRVSPPVALQMHSKRLFECSFMVPGSLVFGSSVPVFSVGLSETFAGSYPRVTL